MISHLSIAVVLTEEIHDLGFYFFFCEWFLGQFPRIVHLSASAPLLGTYLFFVCMLEKEVSQHAVIPQVSNSHWLQLSIYLIIPLKGLHSHHLLERTPLRSLDR